MGGKRVFELILEIGHKSSPLPKKTANGYTHKWTAFVRGANNSRIEHCIQRVVFQLHESFQNPQREVTSPPFQIKETGYAGFNIPIHIYFKNREKPNFIERVHDLCLMTTKPNNAITTEKVKFINPNRDFEKCLIKSGAQLVTNSIKKERSHSPPAKKHKSSSIIPTKDMNNKSSSTPQSLSQSQQHTSTTHRPSLHTNNNHTSNSTGSTTNTIHHNHVKSNHHNSHSHSSSSSSSKPKPSREFVDLFGAPIVYNKSQKSSIIKEEYVIKKRSTPSPLSQVQTQSQTFPVTDLAVPKVSTPAPATVPPALKPTPSITTQAQQSTSTYTVNTIKDEQSPHSDLKSIQTRISRLSDSERLQKIVDIIEESREWFNITPKKFEFDLKRLDRKTLNKIERCLH